MNRLKTLFSVLGVLVAVFGCAHHPTGKGPASLSDSNEQAASARTSAAEGASADQGSDDAVFTDESLDFLKEEENQAMPDVADPLFAWNQRVFVINDRFYFYVLKPAARAYRMVAPQPVRIGVSHFFRNLMSPIRIANSLLQGKFKSAGYETQRFFINSTVGMAGFHDLSPRYAALQTHPEDLGQTLGHYGMGEGLYIIWPILGPSTLRDSLGMIGDLFIDPLSYYNLTPIGIGEKVYREVNRTSLRIGDYEALKEAAIDPYISLRNAYIQFRRKQIQE